MPTDGSEEDRRKMSNIIKIYTRMLVLDIEHERKNLHGLK